MLLILAFVPTVLRAETVEWELTSTSFQKETEEAPVFQFLYAEDNSTTNRAPFKPLPVHDTTIYDEPISGWSIADSGNQSPFIGIHTARREVGNDLPFEKGDILVGPGLNHPVVLAFKSPAAGIARVDLMVKHHQKCCQDTAGIRWFVEQGSAPSSTNAEPRVLAQGALKYDEVSQGRVSLSLKEIELEVDGFLYLIIDCQPDQPGTAHHGDGTIVQFSVSMDDPVWPEVPVFESDVFPILENKCIHCHGSDDPQGGLELTSVDKIRFGGESGPALVPGSPNQSFVHFLVSRNEMPPAGEEPLTPQEKQVIHRWIQTGAKSETPPSNLPPRSFVKQEVRQQWQFMQPVRPSLPEVQSPQLLETAIDSFVLARLEANGLSFSRFADREAELRRVYFDLLGLPPPADQVAEYMADDRPDAYARLVERLLADPAYGERWSRHWMDAVGYVDNRLYDGDASTIYEHEGMWHYRDYIIQSHNRDLPWNTFLTEQLAGDTMVDWQSGEPFTAADLSRLTATGFLRNVEDHTSEAQYGKAKRYDVLFDLMEMVSGSLFGMTMHCSRCHNHKFDGITQRDYFSLMAYFEDGYDVDAWQNPVNRWLPTVGAKRRAEIDRVNGEANAQIAMLNKQLAEAKQSGQEARITELQQALQHQRERLSSYEKVPVLLATDKSWESRVLRRGLWDRPGISVSPAPPEAMRPVDSAYPQEGVAPRRELADWLVSSENPLTARVIMNRVWSHHFGSGIVKSLNNFGVSGSGPTHPELLDWLAVEFRSSGWSLKHVHRLILNSRTYRQSSKRLAADHPAEVVDPANDLLWRQNLRRLESEIIRDALLAASGQLVNRQSGPPVRLSTPNDGVSDVPPVPDGGHLRRSVYLFHRRVYPLKFMETFDSPLMPVSCEQRVHSTTVLQSFALLNSPFATDSAEALSVRCYSEKSLTQSIEDVYLRLFARYPHAEEVEVCLKFVNEQAAALGGTEGVPEAEAAAFTELCHMLLASNEFLYVE